MWCEDEERSIPLQVERKVKDAEDVKLLVKLTFIRKSL